MSYSSVAGLKREARLPANDPAIHLFRLMDARVKPAHDSRKNSESSIMF